MTPEITASKASILSSKSEFLEWGIGQFVLRRAWMVWPFNWKLLSNTFAWYGARYREQVFKSVDEIF